MSQMCLCVCVCLLTSGLRSGENEVVLSSICDFVDVNGVLPPGQEVVDVH